jgi:hypothetical protein
MTVRQMISFKAIMGIAGIALVLSMFATTCNKPGEQEGPGRVDTVTEYKTHIDTVFFPKIMTKTIAKIINTRDTIYIDSITQVEHKFNIVDTHICDSLIEGTISTVMDGTIVAQDFTYKALFPKYIIKTDSIVTTITAEAKLRNSLYLGMTLAGNKSRMDLGPIIVLTTKKHLLVGYNYGIINNTHNVSIGYKLFK